MNYFQRGYQSGPPTKRPRTGPRNHHMMSIHQNQPRLEDDPKRLQSFKEFVLKQENDINEQEALEKYSQYKTAHTKRRIAEFYNAHKEEEWFRLKYRPTELEKVAQAEKEFKAKRKELYAKLIEYQKIDNLHLDYQHKEDLAKFLENFSLLLEGASLDDLDDPDARRQYAVSSIYIPYLHPSIDKAMLKEYAKKHPGFLRVALSDADKDFKRSAWVTYKYMKPEELQNLVWSFNSDKFNGQEMKSMVNRENHNRILFTQFWFNHKKTAKADLKNATKLLTHFEGDDCPLLEGIKDHIIEVTNGEEKSLGIHEENESEFSFEQDPEIFKALDKVLLYLRLVHSYDYYAAAEYTGENDMPQRIGIMTARAETPLHYGDRPDMLLNEFIQAHVARIDAFLKKPTLSESETKDLGYVDPDLAAREFIFSNVEEKTKKDELGEPIGDPKYRCKISGKKFSGYQFCVKHIENRFPDLIEEARVNAIYFNNYIADPNRPM